jgi:hypothetical protein
MQKQTENEAALQRYIMLSKMKLADYFFFRWFKVENEGPRLQFSRQTDNLNRVEISVNPVNIYNFGENILEANSYQC